MSYKVCVSEKTNPIKTCNDAKIGDIGYVYFDGGNKALVLKIYQDWVNLEHPDATWDHFSLAKNKFQPLPRGASVSLIMVD